LRKKVEGFAGVRRGKAWRADRTQVEKKKVSKVGGLLGGGDGHKEERGGRGGVTASPPHKLQS